MELKVWPGELHLTHKWTIARGSATRSGVVFVELRDENGVTGQGEASPSRRYQENLGSVQAFLDHVDPKRLSFDDPAASAEYLEQIAPGNLCAKGAINIALLDGQGKKEKKAIYDLLGLGFREGVHYTSFSIGIDAPGVIREKVKQADGYPVLKLKVGVPGDRENLAALREVAPTKRVRVDANEGWKTKEQALEMLEWLAADGHVEFCEQPLPSDAPLKDQAWLKERSPLMLVGDESCVTAADVARCVDCFHGVNVKLIKAGGISGGFAALSAARKAGLKTMIGCMIESSILISAAAHLAELADYLDIDGNLLITDDPYIGPTAHQGLISFQQASEPHGLRVRPR